VMRLQELNLVILARAAPLKHPAMHSENTVLKRAIGAALDRATDYVFGYDKYIHTGPSDT